MSESRLNLVLSAAALAIALACAVIVLGLPSVTWLAVRAGLILGSIGLSGVVLVWSLGRSREDHRTAQRYLKVLSESNYHDLKPDATEDPLPLLENTHPWHQELTRLRHRLSELCSDLSDAEHTRATLEIRARRNQSMLDRVSGILNSLSEPIVAVDAYESLMFANPSARRLLGIGTEPGKRSLAETLGNPQLAELLEEVRRRRVPTSRVEEIELTLADGQAITYRATASNLLEERLDPQRPDAEPPGAVLVLRDVSHQKVIQRQNAEFVSAVSHEMKTPLAGIKAYVELLADGDAEDAETRDEFLGVIDGQTERLRRLIDNLLNLARIEAGVVRVSKEAQSVNDICNEALGVVRPSAEAKQIRLASYLSPLYLGVLADRDMLLQAVINLLSNAVKYTPPGGKVTLRSRLVDDAIEIGVQDTGVGLSADDSRRVFDKFYRVDKDKNLAPGTGLGLPLVKHIVEDVHGGQISVESEQGRGSTFTISIPRCSTTT